MPYTPSEFDNVLNSNTITTPYVELFTLDVTPLGGMIYYFTPNGKRADNSDIIWRGNVYTPMPITTSGWEITSDGTQAKPTVSVSLVSRVLLENILNLGDLVGAHLHRMRTFDKFLDGQAEADQMALFPPDQFIIEQKLTHTNEIITWSLTSVIDRFGMKLPRRQMLRDDYTVNGVTYQGFPGISRYRGPR